MDAVTFVVMVALGSALAMTAALVVGARLVYRGLMAHQMQSGTGSAVVEALPMSPEPLGTLEIGAAPASAGAWVRWLARRRRQRTATYLAASAALAVVHTFLTMWRAAPGGLASALRAAGNVLTLPFQSPAIREVSLELVALAARGLVFPLLITLALLLFARFERPAAGLWLAALIVIWLPFGALQPFGETPWLLVLARGGLGLLLALAFLRLNAWLADRSRWSWQARLLAGWWLIVELYSPIVQVGSALLAGKPPSQLPHWVALAVLPFATYLGVLWLLFRRWSPAPRRRLLLLRVFGRSGANERFYARLMRDWSFIGPLRTIAAPDVASMTMTPSLLALFASGRLRRAFQWTEGELDRRAARADVELKDRRFGRLEVLSDDASWKTALQRLARDADAVLMDLRGYSARRSGATWEISYLLASVPLERIILCTDQTTNELDLRTALESAWRKMPAGSPNRGASGAVQVLQLQGSRVDLAAAALAVAERPHVVDARPAPQEGLRLRTEGMPLR